MANGPTLPPQAYTREILTNAFNWLQSQPESVRKIATTPDALVGLFLRAQRYGNSSLEADAPISSQSFISDLKNLAEGLKQFEAPRDARRNLNPGANSNASFASSFAANSSSTSISMAAPSSNTATATMTATKSALSSSLQGRLFPPVSAAQLVPTSPTPPTMPTPPSMPVSQAQAAAPVRDVEPESAPASASSAAPSGHSSNGTTVTSVSTHTSTTSVATTSVLSSSDSSQITGTLNARTLSLIQEVKDGFNLSNDAEAINLMVSMAYKKLKDLLP
jgi:hypothetical protein